MRDLAELGLNEGGRPVTRAAPTADQIQAFEQAFNVRLPADYVQFLQYSNGGHPFLDLISLEKEDDEGEEEEEEDWGWGVNHFLFLNDDHDGWRSIWRVTKHWRDFLKANVVAIAETGSGDPFLLDYNTDPPQVIICLHEFEFACYRLAPSFLGFINRLGLYPENYEPDDERDGPCNLIRVMLAIRLSGSWNFMCFGRLANCRKRKLPPWRP